MAKDPDVFKESTEVIQEIEKQLEKLLEKKTGEVESDLEDRIQQEKDTAQRRKDEIKKDFLREQESLNEYRTMIRETEAQRSSLLNEIREHFKKILHFQGEIENLAKATADEIKKINEIQRKLEDIREKTADRAAFLKNDLRERFGIIADVPEEKEEPLKMDLERELEKLHKIKELLAMERSEVSFPDMLDDSDVPASEDAPSEPPAEEEKPGDERTERMKVEEEKIGEGTSGDEIPEIADLVETAPPPENVEESMPPVPEEIPSIPEGESKEEAAAPPAKEESPEAVDEAVSVLESYRKSEPSNGSGEIHYFQKGIKAIIDGERLIIAIEKTLEEAQRLSEKLQLTDSPKDQFFIKQELINWQEGLRALFLRVIKMSEKRAWFLPTFTSNVLSIQTLRDLLERLSMENWSNPEEFAIFRDKIESLKSAYLARLQPRSAYITALRSEVESE